MKKKVSLLITALLTLSLTACNFTIPEFSFTFGSNNSSEYSKETSKSASTETSSKENSNSSAKEESSTSSDISSSSVDISSSSEIISSSSSDFTSSIESSSGENSSSSEESSFSSESSSSEELSSSIKEMPSTSEELSESSINSDTSLPPDEPHIVNLEIFAFNDFHGNVIDSDNGIGLSKTSTFIKENSVSENTILISQGDMWQGSAESNMTRGELVTDWMNQEGFVSMTLGNHEFDWGQEYIAASKERANFPILACNIYNPNTYQLADYCQRSVVIEKGGAKIGIIGAIGDCYSSITASKTQGITFLTGNDLTMEVKEEAEKLKEQGCDMVIYSLHDDDSAYDISLSGDYVDLVFEGHTHQNYVHQDSKGVYHIQGGGYNKTIPYINFDLDLDTNSITVNEVTSFKTNDYVDDLDDDETTDALIASYSDVIGNVRDIIGNNSVKRNANELKQLVANLYLEIGLDKWGDDYGIFLGGGYISCRPPYYLQAGPVSYADIYDLFPFDNDIALCRIEGRYLKSRFVNSTDSNYFISYSTYGNNNIDYIEDYTDYYVIVDSFSYDYSYNRLTMVERYTNDTYYARDLLKDYAIAGGFEH